jgi:hypothetical protein
MKIKRFSYMNKDQLKEAIKESMKNSGASKEEEKGVTGFRYPKRLRKSPKKATPKKATPKKATPKKSVIKNLDDFML